MSTVLVVDSSDQFKHKIACYFETAHMRKKFTLGYACFHYVFIHLVKNVGLLAIQANMPDASTV